MRHLTVHEAADALQLSVPTIKRYIYDGKLKSTKLPGGQHRIPQSEIDALLALQEEHDGEKPLREASASTEQRVLVLERWVTELEAEIERLTAALEVVSRYCARKCEVQDAQAPEAPGLQSHRVAVLGPGCRRCNALHDLATRVLKAAGRPDVVVERVSDLDAIAAYGPVLTPALMINDAIVFSGRVPSEAALQNLLRQHLQ
jgi:excisionase family DNA binding protein